MNNFDAIGQLDVEKMENFLDQVFLTGLNTGMHAATLNDTPEVQAELLDRNPFDLAWLSAEAEKLSFLNEVLCFFGVDIFSFSLNFFIMIFVFLFCKSSIFPAFKTLYSPSVWVI